MLTSSSIDSLPAAAETLPWAGLGAVLAAIDTLVASAEPAVVFSSAVRLCVPLVGQAASATITGPENQAYAITWPRTQPRHAAYSVEARIIGGAVELHAGYHGTLAISVDGPPQMHHALLAQLIVDRAVALVERERWAESLAAGTTRSANLEVALATNREIGIAIGILMSRHKSTSDQAFDILRRVSQESQRKLRDVALEVAVTGTIELPRGIPAATVTSPRRASHNLSHRSPAHLITHCG